MPDRLAAVDHLWARIGKKANGAWGRNRTADTVIFSHVLYQLSYPGITLLDRQKWTAAVGSAPMAKRDGLGKTSMAKIFDLLSLRDLLPPGDREERSHLQASEPDRDRGSAWSRRGYELRRGACRRSGSA